MEIQDAGVHPMEGAPQGVASCVLDDDEVVPYLLGILPEGSQSDGERAAFRRGGEAGIHPA